MDVYFGIVTRGAPVEEGGELVCLDWSSKKPKARVLVFPEYPRLANDPNPRGGSRGCRGVDTWADVIVGASYHALKIFDRRLNHLRDISHGLMVDVHEIACTNHGSVCVASTGLDSVLEFGLERGELLRQYWPREMPSFQRELGVRPKKIDKAADHRHEFMTEHYARDPSHLHIAGLRSWNDNLFAVFNRFGAIANLTTGETVVRDRRLVTAHNLCILPDGTALVNNTASTAVWSYDLSTGRLLQTVNLLDCPWARQRNLGAFRRRLHQTLSRWGLVSKPTAMPLFLRGLAVHEDRVFVGLSPAAILCIDRRSGELRDLYQFSDDVHVCLHGLRVLAA